MMMKKIIVLKIMLFFLVACEPKNQNLDSPATNYGAYIETQEKIKSDIDKHVKDQHDLWLKGTINHTDLFIDLIQNLQIHHPERSDLINYIYSLNNPLKTNEVLYRKTNRDYAIFLSDRNTKYYDPIKSQDLFFSYHIANNINGFPYPKILKTIKSSIKITDLSVTEKIAFEDFLNLYNLSSQEIFDLAKKTELKSSGIDFHLATGMNLYFYAHSMALQNISKSDNKINLVAEQNYTRIKNKISNWRN